jgi:hypothetical protein
MEITLRQIQSDLSEAVSEPIELEDAHTTPEGRYCELRSYLEAIGDRCGPLEQTVAEAGDFPATDCISSYYSKRPHHIKHCAIPCVYVIKCIRLSCTLKHTV